MYQHSWNGCAGIGAAIAGIVSDRAGPVFFRYGCWNFCVRKFVRDFFSCKFSCRKFLCTVFLPGKLFCRIIFTGSFFLNFSGPGFFASALSENFWNLSTMNQTNGDYLWTAEFSLLRCETFWLHAGFFWKIRVRTPKKIKSLRTAKKTRTNPAKPRILRRELNRRQPRAFAGSFS